MPAACSPSGPMVGIRMLESATDALLSPGTRTAIIGAFLKRRTIPCYARVTSDFRQTPSKVNREYYAIPQKNFKYGAHDGLDRGRLVFIESGSRFVANL